MADVTYFKKFDDGETRERVAYTPADHVQLKFDGWRVKADTAKSAPSPGDTKSTK